jgi:hypothetical protein
MAASDPERNDASLIEHYRQANSDLKLSDLALLIHVRATGSWTRQSAVSAIDNELQEVRDGPTGTGFGGEQENERLKKQHYRWINIQRSLLIESFVD